MTTPDHAALAAEIAQFYDDPLGFVLFAYPWKEPSTFLEHETGPDVWQRDTLISIGEQVRARAFNGSDPVEPIREAVASGHGIGKSALMAWLRDWLMSTRPNCKGTITASTSPQLETKTWPEMAKWTKVCVTSDWFEVTMGRGSMKMVAKSNPDGWRCTAQTSREENSESFAGQHAADSSSWYMFDEGSAVPNAIYEVAEGGLTDGEPHIFVFGNPTRSSGAFYDIFHKYRGRWRTRHVDARTAKKPNKRLHQQWIDDYGIDSDFVKVRILGQFPNVGAMQWIGNDVIEAARRAEVLEDRMQRMIIGVDCARGGGDDSVIARRRGRDARSWPWHRINTRDTMTLVGRITDVYNEHVRLHDDPIVMIDSTGLGGPIYDRLLQIGINVVPCNFGSASTSPLYSNKRTQIWGELRDWLQHGGAIPDEQRLADDLRIQSYHYDKANKWILDPKEDLDFSPDAGDALAVTFTTPVPPRDIAAGTMQSNRVQTEYNLFA